MTSKEVVKEILKMITVMNRTELTFMTKDGVPVAQFKKEDVEQAEKDLEVLEILKENNLLEYLIEKELFETANSYCGNTNKERERVKDYRNNLNKIKEWLENDK